MPRIASILQRDTPFGSTFFAGASAVAQQRYTSGFKDYADVSAIVNELRGVQARM